MPRQALVVSVDANGKGHLVAGPGLSSVIRPAFLEVKLSKDLPEAQLWVDGISRPKKRRFTPAPKEAPATPAPKEKK